MSLRTESAAMGKTVLVPVDGSPLSFRALRYAVTEFPDASITVINVIDLYEPDHGASLDDDTTYEPPMGSDEWYTQVEEAAERLLDEARDIAADHGREIDTVSDIGEPARIIVDYADEEDVDHVAVGAHGRSSVDRPLYGSVTEVVARRSPVSVTIVR
jgi:nucleotide-binding universal stress UspA family protein